MEIELEPEEKSVDSFQAEMDLVKEEEETENRLSQKERKELILAKIKNQISSNEESQENPQVLRANPNVLRAAQKKEEISNIPEPFVPNFKLNQRYFYQTINIEEWNEINSFIEKFIDNDLTENDLEEFFDSHRDGTLFLPESTYNVEVFASLHVDAYDAIAYSYGDRDESDMDTLLNYVRDNAVIYRDIGVTKNDKILALSTCDNHHLYGRSLVYCRLTARGFISQGENKTETRVYKSESYTVRRGIKRYSWAIVNLICLIVSLCGGLDLVLKFENRKEYYIGIIIELLLNLNIIS